MQRSVSRPASSVDDIVICTPCPAGGGASTGAGGSPPQPTTLARTNRVIEIRNLNIDRLLTLGLRGPAARILQPMGRHVLRENANRRAHGSKDRKRACACCCTPY